MLSSVYHLIGSPDGFTFYSRWSDETWHPAEELTAGLEGSPLPVFPHSSGMAAMANAMYLSRPGTPITMPRRVYYASLIVAHDCPAHEGGQVREADAADADAVIVVTSADGEAAGLVWAESLTNPMLEVADIPATCEATHTAGTLIMVDNIFATPLRQCPLEADADVVVHSATKYLSGHSDVVPDAALAPRGDLHEALHEERTDAGGVVGPVEAWFLPRSMRTPPLRMERIWASAAELAHRPGEHPLVAEVRHPLLPSHPQYERIKRLTSCFDGALTMRLVGGLRVTKELGRFVRIWLPATLLGGVESNFERRRRFPTKAATVPKDLLRVSVGIEDVEDLWRDLDAAPKEVHQ